MLKKIIIAAIVALPLTISAQSAKFGYCNSQDIIPKMQEYVDAEAKLKAVQEQYTTEGKKIEAELQKKYQAYEEMSKSATTTDAQRKTAEDELQALSQKYQNFMQAAQQDIQQQQQQQMAPVMQKFNDAVQSVGKENAFTFIYETTALIYTGADAQDVTPLVKAKLGVK